MSLINTVGQPINWPLFWQTYKQYALWDLEWFDGSEWVSVKEDLAVQLSYPEPNKCKVNLVFDASHAGNYRLTHAVDKVVREHISRVDRWQYELTYDDISLVFDWSDCKDIPGLQFSHGIKDGYFWFRIRRDNVPLGAHVEIDPATVATSTDDEAVQFGYMRKGFYAEGLFWAFYSDGTNAGWEFSADGTTWVGAFTSIGACTKGYRFSIWFDGTYVHYVRYDGVTYDLFYRRGVPENDGTITWSAAEQTVHNGTSNDRYTTPCITVDTGGFAWIGSLYYDGAGHPVVLKNSENDGTWTTDFVYELSATNDTSFNVCPVPLTGGKVYVIYCRNSQAPLGNLWNGAAWVGEENDLADYNISFGYLFSAVALEDNVHLVYTKVSSYQIRHNERVWGVGWDAADVLVQDSVLSATGPALSADSSTGDLYCFWASSATDHVYYKKYDAGWDVDPTDWIDETTDDINADNLASSFYMDYGGYIGLLYVTKLASPFNVRFAFLQTPAPPVEGGGLRMILGLRGHMGYDLKTRGGKARRRMW